MAAHEQGSKREAEKYFLDGLRITPEHALILTSLGHLYVELDQLRSAIDILLQATWREPNLPDGWYELGRAYMKTRDWKSALKALDHARQLSPDASTIYSAMATCYQKMNKKTEARQKTDEALLLDPNNSEAIRLQRQL
jgi:predicted Zn-dependent protease